MPTPSSRPPLKPPDDDPEPELQESDPEALLREPQQGQETERVDVTYEIVHSPTYRVPVLYITLPLRHPFPSADELYALLVPELYRPSLQNERIGVLGALSATTHPETGRSCFWVHPCLTQEGMEGLGLKGENGVKYLMGWIGIVGGGVGLDVPVEVAREVVDGTVSPQ